MPQVRSDGAWIDYLDEGLGDPALLLLPGWCGTRAAFDPVIGALSAGRRVLSPDLRGHGASSPSPGDFGMDELVRDALTVIADSGAQSVVPVALAHAGWVAIELRRRLAHEVPGIVLVDWIVTPAPSAFLSTLEDLRSDADRDEAVAGLLQLWQGGVTSPELAAYLADMGAADDEMWDRAAREIEQCLRAPRQPAAGAVRAGPARPGAAPGAVRVRGRARSPSIAASWRSTPGTTPRSCPRTRTSRSSRLRSRRRARSRTSRAASADAAC